MSKHIHIEKAYLFGSYARGDYLKTSDIDLIIISRDFKDIRFTEQLDLMEDTLWKMGIRPHIQVIPLTKDELINRMDTSFLLMDASKYWIRIK